jgi:hypothetical protein
MTLLALAALLGLVRGQRLTARLRRHHLIP